MTREHALKLRELILKASVSLDDESALQGIELFPTWKNNTHYSVGVRVRFNEVLYKCV